MSDQPQPPPDRPLRPPRAETREVIALKELKAAQPDLATAVDMQIALVDMQRRMQSRVPLPWISADDEWLQQQEKRGRALVRFGDIPLDWTDFRLIFRQTADVLLRFDALEAADHGAIVALAREGNALEPVVEQWYAATSGAVSERPDGLPPSIDHVLVLAMRPFLARCAEVLRQRAPLTTAHRLCPFCGWEPDFAVITPSAERHLICGRCSAQWPFPALTCPYCNNDDRSRITSFATRDGRYRVYGCDVCHRYLKAYDGRQAARPVIVVVDTIATLPLDAAAMQRGYN
ncbi:MAG TPA: formate dehydrogenase accessory protein FdhE [Vicinamibacterales bacterium]|nr:formate dehydrogenase accessory protein FdhE [Vicinamibacterales bacterium]